MLVSPSEIAHYPLPPAIIQDYCSDNPEMRVPNHETVCGSNSTDEFVEFPWKNTTAIVDIEEYKKCLEDAIQRRAAVNNIYGTDTTIEGNRLKDNIRFLMDMCVSSNSKNQERIFEVLEEAAAK